MKKQITTTLIIGLVFLLSSFTKKLDSNVPILGKWMFVEETYEGETHKADDCTKKSYVEYKVGGKFLSSENFPSESGKCEGQAIEGTWKQKSDNVYTITMNVDGVEMPSIDFTIKVEGDTMTEEIEGSVRKYKRA